MLDLHRLVLLREIKLRGSMSGAARTLAYSHSAISQQMSILEREVGVVLLERAGRGVRLTPAAEQLVTHTESLLAILEKAESDLAGSHARVTGSLVLATFGTASRVVVPGLISRLARLFPDLRVDVEQLEPEESLRRLASRRLDLVIADEFAGSQPALGPAFHTTLLHRDPIRAYLPVGSQVGSVRDLSRLAWVLEPVGTDSHTWAQRLCRDLGFEPHVKYQSPDLLFHLRMVEAGLAAAFLPELATRESGRQLVPSPLFPGNLERTIHAVSREGSQDRPAVLACRRVIVDVLSSLSDPNLDRT